LNGQPDSTAKLTSPQASAGSGPDFIKVPIKVLRDARLAPAAKLLYGRLVLFLGKTGIHQPGHERLALEIGVTPRQVRYLLAQLRKCGYIDSRRTQRGTCRYRILERQNSAVQDLQDEGQERQFSAGENGNISPEGAAIYCLHKDGLKEVSKEGTTSTAASPVLLTEKHPIDWPVIQDLIGGLAAVAIDGGARQRIQKDLNAQGMDGRHLKAYLERFPIGRSKNPVGVLISIVPKLTALLKDIDPDEPAPMSAFERSFLKVYRCATCEDTGRVTGKSLRKSVGAACRDCERGKEAWKEDHQAIADQMFRLDHSERQEKLDWVQSRGGDRSLIESLMGCMR
jgi:DNA-directed RNA polymerase subunit RPC12/RpoP